MADSNVAITAGSGTNIDTQTQANGDHRQVVVLGDAVNTYVSKVHPFGLETFTGLSTTFYDTFAGPLDTTNKWTVTGNAPTFSGGTLVMSATLSSYNAIRTQAVITANAGYTVVRNGITLEASAATGAGRFWGLGTPAVTTGQAAVLAQDGIGFEIDQAAGTLLAVTYAAGARTTVATLTRPTDGATHAYELQFRVTSAVWLVDGVQVASASFPNVQVVEIPALLVRQNAASFTGTPVFTNLAHLTGQTDPQVKQISDATYTWRKAQVGKNGGLAIKGAGVTGQTLAVSAATPVTGAALDVSEAGNVTFIVKNTVAATAFTGNPVVVFEQSDDGTSWGALNVVNSSTGVVSFGTTILAAGVANTEVLYDAALEGVNWVRARVTTAPTANGMTIVINPGGLAFSPVVAVGNTVALTGTITSPALAVSSFTVLAANPNRKGATFYNDSTNVLYLALAATASTTAYTLQIAPGGYYELPVGSVFTGLVSGIATVASGNVRVTELT